MCGGGRKNTEEKEEEVLSMQSVRCYTRAGDGT